MVRFRTLFGPWRIRKRSFRPVTVAVAADGLWVIVMPEPVVLAVELVETTTW